MLEVFVTKLGKKKALHTHIKEIQIKKEVIKLSL